MLDLSRPVTLRVIKNVLDQLPALALLFLLIFGLNVIPAFAPPTWMALAFVGFRFPGTSPLLLALVGAVAATSGRLVLARLSHWLVRGKLRKRGGVATFP